MTFRSLRNGFRALFRRDEVVREVDEELDDFVAHATSDNLRRGMSADDAARAARTRLGSRTAAREEAMSGGWENAFSSLLADFQYGFRSVRKRPGFAMAVILTMALGIGATTSMFSVLNAVLLRPLPWRDASELTFIWTDDVRRGLHREGTAYQTIADWRSLNRSFTDISYFATQRVAPIAADERGRTRSGYVAGNLFQLLGVAPAMGRTLSSADETDRSSVAVISHSFWQTWFKGDSNVIGKAVTVEDPASGGLINLTVVGVMPSTFYFPDQQTEIWTPASTHWRFDRDRDERFATSARRWAAIGRMRDHVSVDEARRDLARVGEYLTTTHVSSVPDFPGFGVAVVTVLDAITGQSLQTALWLLLGAVSLVLLIACVNVANLLLARGTVRLQEFAVRRALGARRGRMARQLVIECVALSCLGGTLGIVVATWGTSALGTAAAGFVPRINEVTTDWRVLSFAFAISIIGGVAFGLGPALRLSQTNANQALRDAGRGTGNLHSKRARDLLVAAECGLALTLLTGAGLLLRSFGQVQAVEPGFDPRNVLTTRIELPAGVSGSISNDDEGAENRAHARLAVIAQLAERVRALPGVTDVGFSDDLYLGGQGNETIGIPGRTAEELGTGELAEGSLSPEFFSVLRVPLRRGRLLTNQDAAQKIRALASTVTEGMPIADQARIAVPEPVVVNEAFVRRFFSGEEAIGKRFYVNPPEKAYWYEIVGVVGDMHRQGLEQQTIPEYFGPWIPRDGGRGDLLVRTTGDPLALTALIREAVRQVIPGTTVVSSAAADALLQSFSALRRLNTVLLTVFAALALALAGIGIASLVHFSVAERTREIGVRVALGASSRDVLSLILRQGMRAPLLGIGVGLIASLMLTRIMASMLFGVGATDPITFAIVSLVLSGVAVAACLSAGRRALQLDPIRALRTS